MGPDLTDRYTVLSLLGSGSTGVVWLAHDDALNRQVAVKHFAVDVDDDPIAVRDVLTEARAAAHVRHENVVAIYDVVENGPSGPFIVMEYVSGGTLAALTDGGAISLEHIAKIAADIGSALQASHESSLCHLDVKPTNVLITSTGRAKLTDFGIARSLGGTATDATSLLGTLAFIAPEVARGERPTSASDIWSMGATIYATLEGCAPHVRLTNGSSSSFLTRRMFDPVPPSQLFGPLTEILSAMLKSNPAERPNAQQIIQALSSAHMEGPIPFVDQTSTRWNLKARPLAATAIGFASIAAAALLLVTQSVLTNQSAVLGEHTRAPQQVSPAPITGRSIFVTSDSPQSQTKSATQAQAPTVSKRAPEPGPSSQRSSSHSSEPSISVVPPVTNVNSSPSTTAPPTTSPPTQSPSPSRSSQPPESVVETVGSYANTWSDYVHASGRHGPTIAAYNQVLITCRVVGFVVQDGNKWWYQIASAPWSNDFYVSADAFYNDGSTSGPLEGTPFVDPEVPTCSS